MAESVVAIVLKQLSLFLHQEYAHLRGLRQGLQFINDELGTMTAFLRDVEAKGEQNGELQEWVKQVREAAYDIEDAIDEFMLVLDRHQGGGFYGRVQNIYMAITTLSARHRICSKINDIKSRVENISARHQRYKLDYGIHGTGTSIATEDNAVRDIQGRAILLEEADLVGIHVRKNELLLQIFDDNSHLKVISVVGMGGIGKTTLIRRVYEDANVRREFHIHAWVTISQTFKIELIIKDLIQQFHAEIRELVPEEVESKDIDSLKVYLKDFLRERRYIIIFDDIWSIDAWEALKYALSDCNCGSRVMLTTRIADIAFASCNQHIGYIYRMKALSDEESWILFCNKSFEDKCCPPHLENVSRRILKKCKGLPLAIASISGILFLKDINRLEEWEKVHRNLGGELEGTGKLNQLKKILLFSYSDLPYYLKGCLLYTSIYPEDFEICSLRLIRSWISEGFVQDREGMSRVEIAEEYLNELVNRNLLQVAWRDVDGLVESCHIHDLVREITLSKAKEQGMITVVKERCTKGFNNARHLVIHDFNNDAQEDIRSKNLRSLRSLVMFSYTNHASTLYLLKSLCSRFKLLKVLDLYKSPLKNIPEEVFKLFHLRYLNLGGSQVEVIPKSIKNLKNLELLDLSDTKVTELPTEILSLGKLRDLGVFQSGNYSNNYSVCGFKAPNEIGALVSLEYLCYIGADNGEIVREIGKLSQLRELGITKLRREDGKQLCCSLEKLNNLRELSVRSKNEDEILDLQYSMSRIPQFLQALALDGHLEQVPQWVTSLKGLTKLRLYRSGLILHQLECLQVLPNLIQLVLIQAYEGERLCFKAGGFQKLKCLSFSSLKRLRCVTIKEGAMPQLKKLFMQNCKLEELPQGVQNLSKLQEVHLDDMPNELIAKLEKKHEDNENYRKIAHVPKIFIGNWIDGTWEGHYL